MVRSVVVNFLAIWKTVRWWDLDVDINARKFFPYRMYHLLHMGLPN